MAIPSAGNARIGYNNLLTSTTTTEAAVMLIPNTWERYRPTSGSKTVNFQMASSSIDFVGIAAHNAGTQDGGVDITVSYVPFVGAAVTPLDTMQFNDSNGALMILFDAVVAVEVVITFNATTNGLELGVIYAGAVLEMEQSIFGGHSPAVLSAKTKYQSNKSETGQFLGRNITREGIETSYKWQHLEDDWYRDNFQPFVRSARKLPFFIKWRPDAYEDTVFGHTTKDIKPKIMTVGGRLMEVGFKIDGHQDVN